LLAGFDASAVGEIRQRLDLARQSGVNILFAIESGSRAWGFASPDSDYDCRFVYAWPAEGHLVLRPQRDVIEYPIEGEIDAGGWDLRKALLLALAGNAVILEWAKSPYVYEEIAGFRAAMAGLLDQIVPVELVARHYLGLLRRHVRDNAGEIRLKTLFYALRPALALCYMEQRDFKAFPPMNLDALMAETTLPAGLDSLILQLVEAKKVTREMGIGPVPVPIGSFIDETLRRIEGAVSRVIVANPARDAERFAAAERFYRESVLEQGLPNGGSSLVNHSVLR
jgi:predicted nucleotidyltransferase